MMRGVLLPCAIAAALGSIALTPACSSSTTPATTALFKLAAGSGSDYYTLPWPNDLRRYADGTIDLTNFPTNSAIVEQYRVDMDGTLDGFGLNAAISSLFSAAIDPSSLPGVADSTGGSASVYLLNIDANSPDKGMKTPIVADFRSDKTETIVGNRLVVRPYPGFSLDEGTTYALVITDRVRDAGSAAIVADDDFAALRAGGGSADALAIYQKLFAALPADEVAHVVGGTVFTTQHATFIAPALRAGVFGTPAPVAANLVNQTLAGSNSDPYYTLWTGTYQAPNFQSGTPPYLQTGGEISVGSDGAAVVQVTENLRFAMTVPRGTGITKPANGWPICVYAHGTGGDYETFVDDGTAERLAQQGIAVISTDQVLAGPRDPMNIDPDVAFFNFTNPYAARDNALQGAADAWSQERLAFGLGFDDGIGTGSASGVTVSVDPTKLVFFGHSQGGLTGPAFIAFEPAVKGAVLSGTGGILYLSLLYKTQPIDITQLAQALIHDTPLDEDNPTLALAQTWIERSDGANYARYFVREPRTAADGTLLAARNIFHSEGFVDTYAPNVTIEAFTTALGGDIVMTDSTMPVEGLTLRGAATLTPPVTGNRANGAATAVLAQYTMIPGSDGHFVDFEVPAAMKQSAYFLGTLVQNGVATVVAP